MSCFFLYKICLLLPHRDHTAVAEIHVIYLSHQLANELLTIPKFDAPHITDCEEPDHPRSTSTTFQITIHRICFLHNELSIMVKRNYVALDKSYDFACD